jgi:hypothetical protein
MLRPQCRAALDGSFTPLVLLPISDVGDQTSDTLARYPERTERGGSATAMSIPFAPEPEPRAEVLELSDDQPTGSLPLGFEFEFFGARYASFDLSSDGFMTFRTRVPDRTRTLYSSIALGWSELYPLHRRRLAYEVRGRTSRRRLVLSLTGAPHNFERGIRRLMAQLILYERTGMIDVHTRCDDAAGHSLNREALRFTTAP